MSHPSLAGSKRDAAGDTLLPPPPVAASPASPSLGALHVLPAELLQMKILACLSLRDATRFRAASRGARDAVSCTPFAEEATPGAADQLQRMARSFPQQAVWALHGSWVTREHISCLPRDTTQLSLYANEVHVDDLRALPSLRRVSISNARKLVGTTPGVVVPPQPLPALDDVSLLYYGDFGDGSATFVVQNEDAAMRALLSPRLRALQVLDHVGALKGDGAWTVGACPRLESLTLHGLRSVTRDVLAALPRTLHSLDLEVVPNVTGAGWDWERLTTVRLRGCAHLLPPHPPRGLQTLQLADTRDDPSLLQAVVAKGWDLARDAPALHTLEVDGGAADGRPASAVLRSAPTLLRRLQCFGSFPSDHGWRTSRFPVLESLDVLGRLTSEHVDVLPPTLRKLRIDAINTFTLPPLAPLVHLELLSLDGAEAVSDADVATLRDRGVHICSMLGHRRCF